MFSIATHGADESRHERDHGRLHLEVKTLLCCVGGLEEVNANVDGSRRVTGDNSRLSASPDRLRYLLLR